MDFSAFTKAAETGTTQEIFAAYEDLLLQEVGAIIFSCSTFNPKTRQAERIYTNMPDTYPVSGLKDVVPNRWTKIVLDDGDTFVANETGGFSDVFPDHPLITSLGCGAVVNMPVIVSGRFMGTVNILHETGFYTPERVKKMQATKPVAMLCFCAHGGDFDA